MSEIKSPRLSVDITEDQRDELARLIPWGWGRPLWHAIIDDIIDCIHSYGPNFISLIIGNHIKAREVMPSISQAIDDVKKVNS